MTLPVAAPEPIVLIVDDDRVLCDVLHARFAVDDVRSESVHDGSSALRRAFTLRPQLILLDLGLPELSGDQVFARLRSDHRTRYTPVIFLTGSSGRTEKVRHLLAGADDYVTKPFDLDELAARVQAAVRRASTLGGLNPLSGLPGNGAIYHEMTTRLKEQQPFACLYLDIDHFKSFNDRYGFTRGDTLIVALAEAIFGAVGSSGGEVFLGHVGGDDFVILCDVDAAERLAEDVVARFDVRSRQLHDEGDLAAGGYEAPDRRGIRTRWPLASVSVGVALSGADMFRTAAALAQAAAQMKGVAKAQADSRVAIDRRKADAMTRSEAHSGRS